MTKKQIIRKWNQYFKNLQKRGYSWNQIRRELLAKGYKASLIEVLIQGYREDAKNKSKIQAAFLILLIAATLISPFFINRPSITGMPIGGPGDIFYVDATNGDDSNDGLSQDSPVKTLAKVSTLPIDPGDTVLFKRGEIWRESFRYSGNSGTSANRIIFGAYGTGNKPKFYGSINGSNPSYWTSLGNNRWRSQENFTLETYMIFYNTNGEVQMGARRTSNATLTTNWDFWWTGNSIVIYHANNPATVGNGIELPKYSTTYQSLVYFDEVDYVTLRDVEVSFTRYLGVEDYLGNYNEFRNIDFKYGYWKALWLEGDNVIADNNSFYLCGIRGQPAPYGQDAQGENIWVTQNTNPIITNNKVERCGGVCINLYHTDGGIVSGNKVWNCEQSPTDWSAGIYYDGCSNSIASYNNISGCQIGLEVSAENSGTSSHNITFYRNIVSNSAISDFLIDANAQATIANYDINVSHNTFYKNVYTSGSGFGNQIFLKYYDTITFKNNIIFNDYPTSGSGRLMYVFNGTSGIGLDSDYNSWNSTIGRNIWEMNGVKDYTSLTSWQSGQSKDIHSVAKDPLFTDAENGDFRPASNSPVCTASSTGSYIGAVPCVDGDPPECGDDECNGLENCSTCEDDCGICPVINNPPTQATPLLNASDHPYNTTNAVLNCHNQSTGDADGDPVTNNYRWFRNNSIRNGLTSSSIGSGNTTPGDSWICEITPYDGTDFGTAKNSSALIIRQLPDTVSVRMNSSAGTNYSDEELRCYANATGFMTTMTIYYRVFNGSSLYVQNNRTAAKNSLTSIVNISSAITKENEIWKCSVKSSYDGRINESEWNNASLTIKSSPTCGDGNCNGFENCSTCALDCGICPITSCTLTDKSWDEDSSLDNAFNLSQCFNDPMNNTLNYRVAGNVSIIVTISSDGLVSLSSPLNWQGVEHVVFSARDSTNISRQASANNLTLTVNAVTVCGDATCESGETCSSCPVDCGACSPVGNSGGSGGGGSIAALNRTKSTGANNTEKEKDSNSIENNNNGANSKINENKSAGLSPDVKQTNTDADLTLETGTKPFEEQKPIEITSSSEKNTNLSIMTRIILILALIGIITKLFFRIKPFRARKSKIIIPGESKTLKRNTQDYKTGDVNNELHKCMSEASVRGNKERVNSELRGVGCDQSYVKAILSVHESDFLPAQLPESQTDYLQNNMRMSNCLNTIPFENMKQTIQQTPDAQDDKTISKI